MPILSFIRLPAGWLCPLFTAVAMALIPAVNTALAEGPPPTDELADYKLQPGDVVKMQVFQVPISTARCRSR